MNHSVSERRVLCAVLLLSTGVVRCLITGFHVDEEGHWVAELDCGHGQHVRHDPPWQNRPWTQHAEGRAAALGRAVECLKCERGEPTAI